MEINVEVLASLFEKEPDVVKEELGKEGGFDRLVNEYKESRRIFTPDELSKKIENANREYVEKLATDGKPIPSHIYNYVKGNAFEKQEKEWAREHGIEKWDNIDDLKRQIIEKETVKSGKAVGDEVLKEYEAKITELKGLVLKSDEEKTKAVEEERGKVGKRMINFDINNAIGSVDIDAEGEKLENQRGVLDAVFRRDYTCEYRDDKTVVFKDGTMLANKVGDPLSVLEVIKDIAPKWVDIKEVSKGGRGGSPAAGKTGDTLKGIQDIYQLRDYAETKGIKPGTAEFLELMKKAAEENPDIKL